VVGRASRAPFNDSWRFHLGDVAGAETAAYDDSGWRELDLPHDWAIEGPFDVKYNARCGGLPFHGTGWYRKTFDVPSDARGKVVSIAFDGAMYNAYVWVNGQFLGNRPYGYIQFQVDISEHLKYDRANVIAVRLTPEDLSSRWYPGAGIYRNVWIDYSNPVHVAQWGTFVTTPEVDADHAVVAVETTIDGANAETAPGVTYEIVDPAGQVVVQADADVSGDGGMASGRLRVSAPQLWSLDDPRLHTLRTTVSDGGAVVDIVGTRFGIRSLESSKTEGLSLNGTHTRIQGVYLHHDNGPLGAAVDRRAIERKLQIMKKMGVNSVRTSHNPPSNELLDLCDDVGELPNDTFPENRP
jgi:beta-galactosidase